MRPSRPWRVDLLCAKRSATNGHHREFTWTPWRNCAVATGTLRWRRRCSKPLRAIFASVRAIPSAGMLRGQEGAFPGEIGGFADAMRYRSRDLRSAEGSLAAERDRLGCSIGPALRAHIPWLFARPEQRLRDAGVHRVDLPIAVNVVLAECVVLLAGEVGLSNVATGSAP